MFPHLMARTAGSDEKKIIRLFGTEHYCFRLVNKSQFPLMSLKI
jgi:hypothetical protein